MMPPMPSSVSCVAVSARRSWLPEDSCSCSSAMDLVASSCRAMEPPRYSRGLYTSDLGKASRRAAAAHAGDLLRDRLQHLEVGVEVARVGAIGETGRDEGALERARLADPHAVIVEVRARAAARGEQLPTHRVVDHRVLEAPPHL